MNDDLRTLWTHRELLWMWILREIRIRYKQSILGAAWAILQPLSMMVVFTIVFSLIARVPTGDVPYPLLSYAALLPWTFLSTAVSFGVPSLVSNLNLVVRTYFPREILPIGAVGASLFDLLVASTLFLGLLFFYRFQPGPTVLLVPAILAIQVLLVLGVTLLGAALNVLFRDIRFIVPLGLQVWMYLSPVIYPAEIVPERFRVIYFLNPMAGIIDSYHRVLLYGAMPNWQYLATSAAVAVGLFAVGYGTFKGLEPAFADII